MKENREPWAHNSMVYNIYYPLEKCHDNGHDDTFEKIKEILDSHTRNYIWNEQEFSLHKSDIIIEGIKTNGFACIYGQIIFGDSIDDEWFIVFLLFELSLHLQSIVITLCDDDGEFLLIECALVLPKWIQKASDDDMKHRVYIYQGKLHIIPKYLMPQIVTVQQGLEAIISDMTVDSVASNSVQEAIKNRLKFCKNIEKHHYHHAVCIIPRYISNLLDKDPCWISLIIKSLTDAVTCLKILSSKHNEMASELVQNSYHKNSGNCTNALVKFTRLQFAQIYLMIYGSSKPKSMKDLAYQLGLKLFLGYECLKQSYIQGFVPQNQKYSYHILKNCEKFIENNLGQDIDITHGDQLNWLYDMINGNFSDQHINNLEIISKKFNELSKKKSDYRGIEIDETDESDSYNSDEEFQVLNAIKNDPDLMMKIIEKSKDLGLEYKDIILKLQPPSVQDMGKGIESSGSDSVWSTDDEQDAVKLEEYFKTMDQELGELLVNHSSRKRCMDSQTNLKGQIFVVDDRREDQHDDV